MKKLFLITLILLTACSKHDIDLKIINAEDLFSQVRTHQDSDVVLINFWATTCGPCIEEFPMIVDLSNQYREKNLAVYFVSADWEDMTKEVISFLSSQGVSGISFLKEEGNDNDFINAIDENWSGAIPFTIVYNKKGNVVSTWEGKKDKEFFENEIISALNL